MALLKEPYISFFKNIFYKPFLGTNLHFITIFDNNTSRRPTKVSDYRENTIRHLENCTVIFSSVRKIVTKKTTLIKIHCDGIPQVGDVARKCPPATFF